MPRRQALFNAILHDYIPLRDSSPEDKDNKEIVIHAVLEYGIALQYASARLRDDKEVVLAAVSNYPNTLQYANTRLRDDKEVILSAAAKNGNVIRYASERLLYDREVVTTALRSRGLSLQFVPKSFFFQNPDLVLEFVKINGLSVIYIPQELHTKEVVIAAVSDYGYAINYASEHFWDDVDVIFAALNTDVYVIQYASERVQNMPDVISRLISLGFKLEKCQTESLKNNKQLIIKLASDNVDTIFIANERFLSDPEVLNIVFSNKSNTKLWSKLVFYINMYNHVLLHPLFVRYAVKHILKWDQRKYYSSIINLPLPVSIVDDIIILSYKKQNH